MAVALRDEDRNIPAMGRHPAGVPRGGCPPGRLRIAPRVRARTYCGPSVAVALRGYRGQPVSARQAPRRVVVAVTLRGDWGSQHQDVPEGGNRLQAWRSSSGATEDRNFSGAAMASISEAVVVALWGDRGSRCHGPRMTRTPDHVWRSPSVVTEDRNWMAAPDPLSGVIVAVVLRDDRGSQRRARLRGRVPVRR